MDLNRSGITLYPIMNATFTFLLITFAGFVSTLTGADFVIQKTEGEGLRILHKGKPFSEYVVDQANKPYLYPVYGPTGAPMTRNYPMKLVEGERHDHPHHRGINFGHEGIGGVDSWSEQLTWVELAKNPKRAKLAAERLKALGRIKHRAYEKLEANDERALVIESCDYLDASGNKVLTEERRMTFRVRKGVHFIDFDQDLIASEGPVVFEDKKDAGLSIRVPTSMDVTSERGGTIVNSEGDRDKAAWSKKAKWCDYHGPVEGERLGVAILNHPSSFRHPTGWHVRTYGLFTANPFAGRQFNKNAPDASFELKAGQRIKLRHRILFHKGDEKQGRVAEAYQAYAKEKK
ncbi:MAG: PmoA family protein [Opitutales bacterium]